MCDDEFTREKGFRSIYGSHELYFCQECAPTREKAIDILKSKKFLGPPPALRKRIPPNPPPKKP